MCQSDLPIKTNYHGEVEVPDKINIYLIGGILRGKQSFEGTNESRYDRYQTCKNALWATLRRVKKVSKTTRKI